MPPIAFFLIGIGSIGIGFFKMLKNSKGTAPEAAGAVPGFRPKDGEGA